MSQIHFDSFASLVSLGWISPLLGTSWSSPATAASFSSQLGRSGAGAHHWLLALQPPGERGQRFLWGWNDVLFTSTKHGKSWNNVEIYSTGPLNPPRIQSLSLSAGPTATRPLQAGAPGTQSAGISKGMGMGWVSFSVASDISDIQKLRLTQGLINGPNAPVSLAGEPNWLENSTIPSSGKTRAPVLQQVNALLQTQDLWWNERSRGAKGFPSPLQKPSTIPSSYQETPKKACFSTKGCFYISWP